MDEIRIERLCRLVEQQQGDIFWLRKEAVARREEVAVLRDCLVEAGVFARTSLYAQMHWRKFSALRATHRVHAEAQAPEFRLDDVIEVDDIAVTVCLHAGASAVQSLLATSKALSRSGNIAWPSVMEQRKPYIYVCGGRAGKRSLDLAERYDPTDDVWEVLPSMSHKRNGAAAGILAGFFYVCGGRTSNQPAMSSVERYDPAAGYWEDLPELECGRWGASAGVVGGGLYICGGFAESGEALSSVERFDVDGIWEAPPATLERLALSAACAAEGMLYLCGGRDRWNRTSAVSRFNPRADVWQAMPQLQETRSHASAASIAGKIYVCGGLDDTGYELNSVECFNIKAEFWELIVPMGRARSSATAVSSADRLYIFGGMADEESLSDMEQFDPWEGRWIPVAPMQQRRSAAAAAATLG